jgi:hypothetical protein
LKASLHGKSWKYDINYSILVEWEIARGGIMQDDFMEMVSSFDAHVQQISWRAREIIHEVMPDVVEVVWKQQRIAGYGVGPKKMTEHFCYIAPQKQYVNLGFYYGTLLPDAGSLMEGSGKLLRHIKIRKLDDLKNTAVRSLVEAAHVERVEALSKK